MAAKKNIWILVAAFVSPPDSFKLSATIYLKYSYCIDGNKREDLYRFHCDFIAIPFWDTKALLYVILFATFQTHFKDNRCLTLRSLLRRGFEPFPNGSCILSKEESLSRILLNESSCQWQLFHDSSHLSRESSASDGAWLKLRKHLTEADQLLDPTLNFTTIRLSSFLL